MPTYTLISADAHINEPPTLWQDRVPEKFKSRAPRMERLEQGDAWIMEGALDPINFGNNISGGLPPEQCTAWKRWEEAPRAGYDPAARLLAQDEDGVDAEILYPTPRPSLNLLGNNKDPEFHLACIRAYNDWLSGFCGHAPDRLLGAALMPTLGLTSALDELERTMKLPGLRTPLLGQWPSAGPTLATEDDAFWAALVEMDRPLSIHISVSPGATGEGDRDPNRTAIGARGELRHTVTPANCIEFIYGGVFDRLPTFNVVFAECDSGWVPYVKEQLDNRFKRLHPDRRPKIKELPSYYFDHHISTTYITDYYGVVNRHFIGVSQMMWSSDYPHTGADFPYSWKTINKHFEGVPEDEKHEILAGNAARVYKLDVA